VNVQNNQFNDYSMEAMYQRRKRRNRPVTSVTGSVQPNFTRMYANIRRPKLEFSPKMPKLATGVPNLDERFPFLRKMNG